MKGRFHDYKKLQVWESSISLATSIFKISATFPSSEIYGITSQIRRCAVSIPSNIAEGAGRNSDKSFSHFLSIAYGSACELETQLIIAKNLGYLQETNLTELSEKLGFIQKMIYKLNISLNSNE